MINVNNKDENRYEKQMVRVKFENMVKQIYVICYILENK